MNILWICSLEVMLCYCYVMQLLQILTCHCRRGEEPRWREGRRHLQGDEDGHPAGGPEESGEQGAEAGQEEGAHPHLAAQVHLVQQS